MAPIDPGSWFSTFAHEFEKSSLDPETEVGLLYETRRRIQYDWDYYSNREWTEVISRFLARLARKAGYVQLSEVDHLDYVWYSGNGTRRRVVIEHENFREGLNRSEVPKLIRSRGALLVLMSYSNGGDLMTRNIKNGVERQLRSRIKPHQSFLLLIGKGWLPQPRAWLGYRWHTLNRSLVPLREVISRRNCDECGRSFRPWTSDEKVCYNCLSR